MSFIQTKKFKSVGEVVEYNTGIPAQEFLKDVRDPYIYNLKEAVNMLLEHKNETIHIVGDYDSDGINATAIMYHGLKKAGFKVTTRLPKRFTEGYGLSEKIIDEISSGVVLTVDNGIAAFPAIKKAKKKKLTVIVTDHHKAPVDEKTQEAVFPDADIIVDPSTEEKSEFHDYCGAAIAYRFVKELLPGEDLDDLLVLASIATVTDIMPLYGANRTLVKDGLYAINHGKCVPGLEALLKELKLESHINEGHYGFTIGPVFNAAGRLYDAGATRVLNLLMQPFNNAQLPFKAASLVQINNRRKEIEKNSMPIAMEQLDGSRPIVVYSPEFGEGIIGLIAGRLCETYQCPVVAFTKTQKGFLKGSGRSPIGIDLKAVLDKIQPFMLGYGGHAGAAGLSVPADGLEAFKKAFTEACGPIPEIDTNAYYDIEVPVTKLRETVDELEKFAPFGQGNPQIRFLVRDCSISDYRRIGNGTHFLGKSPSLTVLGFGAAEKYEEMKLPKKIDCVGYLSKSFYRDTYEIKLELSDFEIAKRTKFRN